MFLGFLYCLLIFKVIYIDNKCYIIFDALKGLRIEEKS